MRILYCQKMIFPNQSAHALHTGMTAANFAEAGCETHYYPGTPLVGGKAVMDGFYSRLGFACQPAPLRLDTIPCRQKGLYGAAFRARLWLAMQSGPALCFASSVKEAVMALELRAFSRGKHDLRVVFEAHHLISRLKDGREAERLHALERRAFTEADMVVFNCRALRDDAGGYLPEPATSAVSPLGYNEKVIRAVRDPARSEPSEERGGVRLAYVGSIQPGKGVENLVRALAQLPEDYSLTIVGGWPQSRVEAIARLAAECSTASRLTFTGVVEQQKVGDFLADCDIYVIPLGTERDFYAPIKMFEALGFGVPVVATPMASLRQTLTDGENALFATGPDPESLASALLRLGNNPHLRKRMRLNNLEAAKQLTAGQRARDLLALFAKELWRDRETLI